MRYARTCEQYVVLLFVVLVFVLVYAMLKVSASDGESGDFQFSVGEGTFKNGAFVSNNY
jgi:hypothetical protein